VHAPRLCNVIGEIGPSPLPLALTDSVENGAGAA
jgi:hypothetical protein